MIAPILASPLSLAERNRLIVAYRPLAVRLSRPFRVAYPALSDDFLSNALYALVRGVATYQPDRASITTYLRWCIRGAMLNTLKARRLAPIQLDDRLAREVIEAGGPSAENRVADLDQIENCLALVPSRQAEVCRSQYLDGRPDREVAQEMGCSVYRIYGLRREAFATIRRRLRVSASK